MARCLINKNKKAMEKENYFDRSKQGFPKQEILEKQIEDHVLLGGDKPVWFAENKITKRWVKKAFNPSGFENEPKDWIDTLVPIEAMVFISREECMDWINKNDLRIMYEPTDHLFSV